MTMKFSTGLWVFSHHPDRFCPEGYRESPKVSEAIALAAKIKGLKAVEVSQTDISSEMPVKEMKRILKDNGLLCSGVNTNLGHTRRFALSGFGHQHQKTRNAAIDEGRKATDLARALGATEITLRLYTDGFDYPFQVDYTAHWNTVISSIKTIAKYASPDINVAIAYKPREPRKHLTVATVGKALSMCQEIAMKNVGVAMNFSHAMMSGENPAESIAFLTRSNKLFQMYFSDGYRLWDDGMMPGSLNLWETMEALFYLKSSKYKGYFTIDMVPQRIEPTHALQIAIGNLSILFKKLEKLDTSELRKAQKTLDATESQRIIRRVMLQ
ncbi:MAG: sugar phosphate isomerase/epimerase [Candidatus Hydrogenedentes bacterium]|jgi:xylose isomerase|nr:sugar phosphate isomerase/epimerase [Candidatus Hydrogenedentota bacterium]